jgi:hypothetical protein
MREIPDDCIGLCEECLKMFTPDEMRRDSLSCKWGHLCKEKNFKQEHRCESYIKLYKEV